MSPRKKKKEDDVLEEAAKLEEEKPEEGRLTTSRKLFGRDKVKRQKEIKATGRQARRKAAAIQRAEHIAREQKKLWGGAAKMTKKSIREKYYA